MITKAIILGPLERLKIVMQVSPIAKYANPTSDAPKSLTDLVSKVTHNQGVFAFYRGTSAYIYKTSIQHGFKFFLYDKLLQNAFSRESKDFSYL